jgi:hypothetical protein
MEETHMGVVVQTAPRRSNKPNIRRHYGIYYSCELNNTPDFDASALSRARLAGRDALRSSTRVKLSCQKVFCLLIPSLDFD